MARAWVFHEPFNGIIHPILPVRFPYAITMKPLSTRQAQIQAMLVTGMTMAEISDALGIKVSTVKTHIEQLYKKRGFKARRDVTQVELDEAKLTVQLTRKQVQVLKGILAGKAFPQLAQEMNISLRTLQSHCATLYKKMGVGTRAQVVALIISQQFSSETDEKT